MSEPPCIGMYPAGWKRYSLFWKIKKQSGGNHALENNELRTPVPRTAVWKYRLRIIKSLKSGGTKIIPEVRAMFAVKGLTLCFHQHHADRLLYPLKRVGDQFERISWEQAVSEIAGKLKGILDKHGPRSLANDHQRSGMPYGHSLCEKVRRNAGNPISLYRPWPGTYRIDTGRMALPWETRGFCLSPTIKQEDMLVVAGWNPMMSHQTPQARRKIKKFADDPDKLLVVDRSTCFGNGKNCGYSSGSAAGN